MQCVLKRTKRFGFSFGSEAQISLIFNRKANRNFIRNYSMGIWYPHRRGFEHKELNLPMKEWIREGAKEFVQESKKLVQEAKDNYNMDRIRNMHANNKELRIHWRFNNEEALKQFQVNCDRDQNRGSSWAELNLSKHQTAIFRG